MNNLTTSPTLLMTLTLTAFIIGMLLQKRTHNQFLHPCLIASTIIILVLTTSGISFKTYFEANKFLHYMLAPCVVALGASLYEQLNHIKGHLIQILSSVIVGGVVAVLSVSLIGWIFGLDDVLIHTFEPKSLTTPIAMSIAENNGGNVSLTAVTVVICGIVGAVIGPKLLHIFHIKNPIARGLAMGCAAHGIGTARAMQMGAIEGAVSGLAIALMGIISVFIIPLYHILTK